jgi:restriction system protein
MKKIPSFDELMLPLLNALKNLGGSGSVEEIYTKVVELEQFSDEVLSQLHAKDKGSLTEIGYRLAWARTYLKKYGFLENSSRGIWALTEKAKFESGFNPTEVVSFVRSMDKLETQNKKTSVDGLLNEINEESSWKETLSNVLTHKIDPSAFERLIQRLLRESGFVQVEVTGRTGDGGIDGKGIARIHGLMSFHVLFQCKKYKGSVGAGDIRDFRGAMVGRADKGLFITTGTFTPAALKEATRDGAPPIDLVDGDELADKLKEFELGLKRELVEKVTVDENWFLNI